MMFSISMIQSWPEVLGLANFQSPYCVCWHWKTPEATKKMKSVKVAPGCRRLHKSMLERLHTDSRMETRKNMKEFR